MQFSKVKSGAIERFNDVTMPRVPATQLASMSGRILTGWDGADTGRTTPFYTNGQFVEFDHMPQAVRDAFRKRDMEARAVTMPFKVKPLDAVNPVAIQKPVTRGNFPLAYFADETGKVRSGVNARYVRFLTARIQPDAYRLFKTPSGRDCGVALMRGNTVAAIIMPVTLRDEHAKAVQDAITPKVYHVHGLAA